MIKKIIAVLAMSFLLVACGDKKIDASTEQSYEQSVKEIAETLDSEQKAAFAGSMLKISFGAFNEADGDEDKAFDILKSKIDGKTYKEIIQMTN
ncbi:hypothetical protein DES39_0832 [Orbus hercynius]|uniref:Lipoprotein n=1 Tax=Orbus hercynius TaxID=593135 RepID=A0A495RJ74_9GAMM|nr:DUF6694 family lipoprotein [Orbus hercynius]RKS87592.1 hypothetical protein DES39_0832 [Orbus hercynius]